MCKKQADQRDSLDWERRSTCSKYGSGTANGPRRRYLLDFASISELTDSVDAICRHMTSEVCFGAK